MAMRACLAKAKNLAAQFADLKAAGCHRIFREKLSAVTADRPELRKLLAELGSLRSPRRGAFGFRAHQASGVDGGS